MKRLRRTWWSLGILACGLLALSGAPGAGQAPGAPPAVAASSQPAAGGLVSAAGTPLLFDGKPAAPEGKAQPAQLTWRDPRSLRPYGMHVRLEIMVHGQPLPTVADAGKTYLPVPRVGAEYEIRVWNDGPRRVVAVVSVDGLSVINGQPASEAQSGYIVAAHSHIVIPGWRRSLKTVAAFRFVERGKSYAGLVGHPENIGVIGLVAFEEQVSRPLPSLDREGGKAATKRVQGLAGSIGTEYGREIDSRVYYMPFVRSGNRRAVTFYYDTLQALRDAGVPVDGPTPVPFPKDGEFAPPPPGYPGR
jgi:hypothetical protein